MNVPIVQFLLPNGSRNETSTELPDECQSAYEEMTGAGLRFEAEILTTGYVSVTISGEEDDTYIEVIKNGPEVQRAMARMLKRGRWK